MGLFVKSRKAPKTLSSIPVRHATSGDVSDVVKLAKSLSIADGQHPSRLTEEAYLRDGFGKNPAFAALVAEVDHRIVGYALYFEGYDTGRAARGLYLSDLYVDQAWRRQGIGLALMQATAHACKEMGGEWMFWSVLKRNKNARKFYRTIAPEISDLIVCAIVGESFGKLSTPN